MQKCYKEIKENKIISYEAVVLNQFLNFLKEVAKIDGDKASYYGVYTDNLDENLSVNIIAERNFYNKNMVNPIITRCNNLLKEFFLFYNIPLEIRKKLDSSIYPWYGFCAENIDLSDIVDLLDLINLGGRIKC